MTGIGYDPKKVGGEITSIEELLTNPKLKGKVTMLTEFGDTIGLVMLANGDDPSKVTDASFDRAVKTIKKAVDSGQIRQFTGQRLRAAAREGRRRGRASRGRATWCSSRPTIPGSSGSCRRTAG